MAFGQGVLPPIDLFGGTNKTNVIKENDIYAYVEAWIKYYYVEFDMYAQFSTVSGGLGPYVSGHIRGVPQARELVGQSGSSPLGTGFTPTMYGMSPPGEGSTFFNAYYVVPASRTPLSTQRAQLWNNNVNEINANKIFDLVQDIFQKQSVISYTIHKYTVYGDGGNKGYYNPSSYSATRDFTFFYNNIHRTWWTSKRIDPEAYTPYGDPRINPDQNTQSPDRPLWALSLIYGTKNFSSRPDLNAGATPVAAGEMEILFVPPSFPGTIQTTPSPWGTYSPTTGPFPSAVILPTPTRRDGRVVQPRVYRWNNARSNFKNTGDVIFRTNLVAWITSMAYEWYKGDNWSATMFERVVCHASCHGSCHSSRGRR